MASHLPHNNGQNRQCGLHGPEDLTSYHSLPRHLAEAAQGLPAVPGTGKAFLGPWF